jgi:hypothetical protein
MPEPSASDVAMPREDRPHGGPPSAKRPLLASRIDLERYREMEDDFAALAARCACANPFMAPALVAASWHEGPPDQLAILIVRDGAERLVGAWALRLVRDMFTLGAAVLQAPLDPRYECLATPVLDDECAGEAFAAMTDFLRASPALPGIIRVLSWPETFDALCPPDVAIAREERWQRAMLAPEPGLGAEAYLRRSMGKALNRRRNRLAELVAAGRVLRRTARGPDAPQAFEAFIALEDRGWKGAAGTALARKPDEAAYMRRMVAALAAQNRIALDQIAIDGEPAAIGVMIEAGGNNIFWKAAFDEVHARFAPGALLHLMATERLFAGGRARMDSGMMEFTTPDFLPWSERAEMARVTLDLGAGTAGARVRAGAALRHGLRRLQRGLRARLQSRG